MVMLLKKILCNQKEVEEKGKIEQIWLNGEWKRGVEEREELPNQNFFPSPHPQLYPQSTLIP